MSRKKVSGLILILTLLLTSAVVFLAPAKTAQAATIVTYPAPDLSSLNNLRLSADYTVKVGSSTPNTSIATYELRNAESTFGGDISQSFANFSFSGGPVTVEVTSARTVNSVEIFPKQFGITPIKNGNKITFTLSSPKKIIVRINGTWDRSLSLWADDLESGAPNPEDPGVIYFGPGVHNIGQNYTVKSGETVYIAGGAVVCGSFRNEHYSGIPVQNGQSPIMDSDITIRGKGILYGGDLKWTSGYTTLILKSIENLTVKDVMIIGTPYWLNDFVGSENITINNTKLISCYHYNTNGWRGNRTKNMTVDDNFVWMEDDGLTFDGSENMRVTNYVANKTHSSAIVFMNFGTPFAARNVLIDGLYVPCTKDLFEFRHYGVSDFSNIIVKNVYADNVTHDHFAITIGQVRGVDSSDTCITFGNYYDILFENINTPDKAGHIEGFNAFSKVSHITFNQFKENGILRNSLSEAAITTNAFVDDVKFNNPHIIVTNPNQYDYVNVNDTITIKAEAHGISSAIDKVEFFVNSVKVGEDISAPYEYNWTPTTSGEKTIQAQAVFGANSAISRSNFNLKVLQNDELLSDSGFETGKGTWEKLGTVALTYDSSVKRTGSKSLKVSGRSSTTASPTQSVVEAYLGWLGRQGNYTNIALNAGAYVRNDAAISNIRAVLYKKCFTSGTEEKFYGPWVSVGTSWTNVSVPLCLDWASGSKPTDLQLYFENSNATEVYYIDDSYCTASLPSYAFYDYYENQGTGNAPSGWAVSNGILTVQEDPSYVFNKRIQLTDASTAAVSATKTFTALSGKIYASFKAAIDSGSSNYAEYQLNSSGTTAAAVIFDTDGYIKYKTPSGKTNIETYSLGKFYSVQMILDTDLDKYTITIDSVRKISGTAAVSDVSSVNNFTIISGAAGNGVSYADVVRVYTSDSSPTPTPTPSPSPTPTPSGAELLENPSFESGKTGWTNYNSCTLTSVTSPVNSGSKSLRIGGRATKDTGPKQDIKSDLLSNGQGDYAFEVMLRTASVTQNLKILININDSTGNHWYSSSFISVGDTGFTKVSALKNLTWSGTLNSAIIYTQSDGGTGDYFVDDFSLKKQ